MATRLFTRSLITTTKQSLLRLRHLVAAAANNLPQALLSRTGGTGVCGFSTRRTSSSLKDPNPNWSNRPPKETILLDGCDFEHWLVVMENPEGDPTRDDIIGSYIKTLAKVVGSEEEARMKIYSVSTRHYYAFGALVSEELSYKLKELDKVRWVLPDSYLHVREKDYGGEPFINGQAVPYDPKYHEEWLRNNNRPPRKDRPNNIGRRRDVQTNRGPPQNNNMSAPPNIHGTVPQNSNMSGPPNMHGNGMPQNNRSAGPPNAYGVPQNMYGRPPNNGNNPPNYMYGPPNKGNSPPNYMSGPSNMPPNNNYSRPPNMSGPPPNINMRGGMQGNNMSQPQSKNYNRGVVPAGNAGGPGYAPTFQHGNVPMNNGVPYQGQHQSNYAPNPHADYPYQNQNLPARDMPSN